MKQGLLIILSGPSGVGKGTLCRRLASEKAIDAVFPVSMTTRRRRLKETDGKEYKFISMEEFQRRIKDGDFLEYTEYCGNFYGTSKEEVERNLTEGKTVILEIETQGARKVMSLFPGMYTLAIFMVPPTMEELERRIRMRHSETEEQIEARINLARKEVLSKDQYDVCLTNYNIKKTMKRFLQAVDRRVAYIEAKENNQPLPEGYIIKRP